MGYLSYKSLKTLKDQNNRMDFKETTSKSCVKTTEKIIKPTSYQEFLYLNLQNSKLNS